MRVPWADVAPARAGGVVRAASVGAADARIGRFSARRASARGEARERARRAVHGWVDDALAHVHADPRQATAAHEAVDANLRVVGVRPLVDGGAVVMVEVDIARLRAACAEEGLPWVD